MTRGQRDKLVQERAAAILGSECTAGAYAVHFDTQLRRRRLLYRSYLRFSRAGAMAAGFDPREIW